MKTNQYENLQFTYKEDWRQRGEYRLELIWYFLKSSYLFRLRQVSPEYLLQARTWLTSIETQYDRGDYCYRNRLMSFLDLGQDDVYKFSKKLGKEGVFSISVDVEHGIPIQVELIKVQ